MAPQHLPRAVLDGVLSSAECEELICLARCLGVPGYRAAVSSCTCFEVAAAEPALLLPLVRWQAAALHLAAV